LGGERPGSKGEEDLHHPREGAICIAIFECQREIAVEPENEGGHLKDPEHSREQGSDKKKRGHGRTLRQKEREGEKEKIYTSRSFSEYVLKTKDVGISRRGK